MKTEQTRNEKVPLGGGTKGSTRVKHGKKRTGEKVDGFVHQGPKGQEINKGGG